MLKDEMIYEMLKEVKEDVKEVKNDLKSTCVALARVDEKLSSSIQRISNIESFKTWGYRFIVAIPVTLIIAIVTSCFGG